LKSLASDWLGQGFEGCIQWHLIIWQGINHIPTVLNMQGAEDLRNVFMAGDSNVKTSGAETTRKVTVVVVIW